MNRLRCHLGPKEPRIKCRVDISHQYYVYLVRQRKNEHCQISFEIGLLVIDFDKNLGLEHCYDHMIFASLLKRPCDRYYLQG